MPGNDVTLWHYTCEHGANGIVRSGLHVLPVSVTAPYVSADKDHPLPAMMTVSWFTDLGEPDRWALGLTSTIIACDRTTHRFKVVDPSATVRWVDYMRAYLTREEREVARRALPGLPLHWYVSSEPVHVEVA